jgi:replicative superfamily II helicase
MPRAFYPIDELIEKTDRLCIINEIYEQVEDYKLEKEIERLEEKRERLKVRANEDFERVINKINSIKNYLNKNKI